MGGALLMTNWTGGRQRLNWPEAGKKASRRRLLAVGHTSGLARGCLSVRMGSGIHIYSVTRSVSTAARDKIGKPPFCCCRAIWRRRGLADKAADELEMFKGAASERWWLGRRRPRQRLLWPHASHRCRPDGGAVGRQGRLCSEGGVGRAGCARGVARTSAGRRQWDAAARAHARAKRALWPCLEHAW